MLQTCEKEKVCLLPPEDESSVCNIMTGQIFSDVIYEDLIGSYDTGNRLYQNFVEERLKPEIKIGIFVPLKKAMIQTCISGNKGVNIKNHNHSWIDRRWHEIYW